MSAPIKNNLSCPDCGAPEGTKHKSTCPVVNRMTDQKDPAQVAVAKQFEEHLNVANIKTTAPHPYKSAAALAQGFKSTIYSAASADNGCQTSLSPEHYEALDNIVSAIARIIHNNPNDFAAWSNIYTHAGVMAELSRKK